MSSSGAATSAGRTDLQPSDHGLLAWSFDPVLAGAAGGVLANGFIFLAKLKAAALTTITNVELFTGGNGAGLVAGQNFCGIYQGGVLLGATADQSANWLAFGVQKMPIVGGPITVAPGAFYVATLANGTTVPTLMRVSGAALVNYNVTGAGSRFAATAGGGATVLPANLPAINANFQSYWVGVS